MNAYQRFQAECASEVKVIGENYAVAKLTNQWMRSVNQLKYSYHFESLGRPIIQYPQDMVAMQELIWQVKPDLGEDSIIGAGAVVTRDVSPGVAVIGNPAKPIKVSDLDDSSVASG